MDSILTSIKKLLGITEEYEHFDPDIVQAFTDNFDRFKAIAETYGE